MYVRFKIKIWKYSCIFSIAFEVLFEFSTRHSEFFIHAKQQPNNKPFPRYLVPLFPNEFLQNLSYENNFDLHENEPVDETHFI